jgi:bifunctional DNA-binding transcriptional regulator/antitoxin component of YhaV-PrlF toxin-antitoxin module
VTVVNVDGRMRVVVPQGVRHRLGLAGEVIVSTNRELGAVRIWPAARLDKLIGGEA